METYSEFMDRINSFELAKMSLNCENFIPDRSLSLKVDGNNRFSSFYGDTVVFDLDDNEKAMIA